MMRKHARLRHVPSDRAKGQSNGVTVLQDPTGMYSRGAHFSKEDFRCTLADGVWPTGMLVTFDRPSLIRRVDGTHLRRVTSHNAQFAPQAK